MKSPSPLALCAALPIPIGTGEGAPEWVHLLPAGTIATVDGRGPYHVENAAELIAASLDGGARLPLDENHATDLAAPKGHPAPARGWIVGLQSRADGIWGQVEWTESGRDLVAGRAYRHISPVIAHRPDGTVTGLLRASLVNRPNLNGLASLHAEGDGVVFEQLRSALFLAPDADSSAILARVRANAAEMSQGSLERQQFTAQLRSFLFLKDDANEETILTRIRTDVMERAKLIEAAGLQAAADGGAVLQAVQSLADPSKYVPFAVVTSLQAELSDLTRRTKLERAERVVDEAIRGGKMRTPATMREHYIVRHMADPIAVEREIGAMIPFGGRGPATARPPSFENGGTGLDQEESKIVALMGVEPALYTKMKAKMAETEESSL